MGRWQRTRPAAVSAGCAALLLLAACGSSPSGRSGVSGSTASTSSVSKPPPSSRPGGPPTEPVTLTGIPEHGVESGCLVLDRYVLVGGDRRVLTSGRAVTVVGHTDPRLASTCQQGTPLVVDQVAVSVPT